MAYQLAPLREANRAILSRLSEREEQLKARARALEDELTSIENERRNIAVDKETIQKAEAIQDRMFGSFTAKTEMAFVTEANLTVGGGQTRARIGAKRYAMWITLRNLGPITVEGIADRTGLSTQRIRDQMKSDQPLYVTAETSEVTDTERPKLRLTPEGSELLSRFENYRRSQGKPLPTLADDADASDSSDASDDSDDDGDNADAATASKDEAVGTEPRQGAPTASAEDALADILGPANPFRSPRAAER